MVYVIKMTGERDEYNPEKIRKSCIRAGASKEATEKIVQAVSGKVYDGMPTSALFQMVHSFLSEVEEHVAARYNLKEAVSDMDSDSFEFEFYIMRLLARCGYQTEHSPEPKIRGHCVEHEIDVVAKKQGELAIIECKHHFKSHTYTGLDVPMRQWARLEDIQHASAKKESGSIPANSAWVVTNTKYSEHAVSYARCKGVELLGWNFPQNRGLNDLIETHKAYPLALLPVSRWQRSKLLEGKIFDVIDFKDASFQALKNMGIKDNEVKDCFGLIRNLLSMK